MDNISNLEDGVTQNQDFLIEIKTGYDIALLMTAFANSSGGKVCIGVKGNGKVIGCNPAEQIAKLESVSSSICKPELSFQVDVIEVNLKLVVVVTIQECQHKPIKCQNISGEWKAFVRLDKQNIDANKIMLGVWKNQRVSHTQETIISPEATAILTLVEEFKSCTLSKLYKSAHLPYRDVDNAVIYLVSRNRIQIGADCDQLVFRSS